MGGQGRPRLLGPEQRRRARELWRQGWSLQRIGAEVGCSANTASREMGRRSRERVVRVGWEPGGNGLKLAERER